MKRTLKGDIRRFVNYIHRTYKLKLIVLALLLIGYISMKISNDGTFFAFTIIFFGPLFFVKEKWI